MCLKAFFTKKYIWYYIAFIVLYRFGEGFVVKIVPLFLKADRAVGGLGLDNQQIGVYYGTFGAAAFVLGSLLAGYYISARGLKRTLFSLCCIFNIPFAVYALLAFFQPESGWVIASGIIFEYFGYGFGFVGLTLFMMQQVAPGKHQMAHYAFASGIMNLGGDDSRHVERLGKRLARLFGLFHIRAYSNHPRVPDYMVRTVQI